MKFNSNNSTFLCFSESYCLFLLLAGIAEGHRTKTESTHGAKALKFLGSVEGKSFFVSANETMSWDDAHAFCKTSGLEMGSVISAKQRSFLKNALTPEFDYQGFWTSAKLDVSPSGFIWENEGTRPDASLFNVWSDSVGDRKTRCMFIYVDRMGLYAGVNSGSTLRSALCQKYLE